MPSSLPEALAEEDETELGQAERREVNEDNDPVGEAEQILRQYESAHAADDQVEDEVVEEPGDPVGGLSQPHHLHRLTDARLLFTHHAIRDTERGCEEAQQSCQRQESIQDVEHEFVVVERCRFVRCRDHSYTSIIHISDFSQDDICHPVLELGVAVGHVLIERGEVGAVLDGIP